MGYKIQYEPNTGIVLGVEDDAGNSIPCSPHNRHFRAFLEWNDDQETPLDWQTPQIPEDIPALPTIEERLSAVEDVTLAILLGV